MELTDTCTDIQTFRPTDKQADRLTLNLINIDIDIDMKGYDAISYKPHLGAISRQSPLATCTTGE